MPVALLLLLVAALLTQQPAFLQAQAPPPGSAAAASLDFEFFRTKVQPIFLAKREGHTRCVSCHTRDPHAPAGARARGHHLERGAIQEELPGCRRAGDSPQPESEQTAHPPASDRGRRHFLPRGGKHWNSFLDPEWQTLANWVCGRKATEKIVELTGCGGESDLMDRRTIAA